MIHSEPATAGRESRDTEVGSVFVSNYPPYSFWSEEAVAHLETALESPPRPDTPFGLYLHIPFCRKRCKFCYFRVFTDKNFDEIGGYLEAMAGEVETYARRPAIAGRKPAFVYFGGGTPSYLSVKQLGTLVERLRAAIPWDEAREVTFECEPGTLQKHKLEAIRDAGVTRLSLGIENFDDDVLRENGRAHLSKEIWRCLPWIEEVGFDQLNIDLIAGMVGETDATWRETVAKTVDLAPDSVTIYQMELPYNTRYSRRLIEGELSAPLADWPTKRAWQNQAFEALARAGYRLSSAYTMVRGDRECNFVYRDSVWRGCDLLGAGVASFSHLSGLHFQNVDGWGEYLARAAAGESPVGRAFATTQRQRLIRELILQMKLGRVEAAPFRAKFGSDILEEFAAPLARLEARGMLEVEADAIRLTREGLLRVDTLLPELYDDEHRNSRYT
ncbi:MAG: coproporphyrinogen-III oxidase family protein [Thermoanaerobaculia bacterium]|nr:coproporphyrinogen-III oxidase family protein [Thermoanaerobaculia bacterium]